MRWPWSGTESDDDKKRSLHTYISDKLSETEWNVFTEPRILLPSVAFTVTTLAAVRIYKSYLRRIPSVNHIKPDYFRRRKLFGRVTSVGDADNFRLYHTPGGRITGWGWLPWKIVPKQKERLQNQTIHVRIAGVDAPELAHWGKPAQPYSKEALDFLTEYILNRRVRVELYRRDQYDRVVAHVTTRKWLLKRDVGLEMLKMGLATVYEAKQGAEFGQWEQKYRDAEERAKNNKVGMWSQPSLLGRLRGEKAKTLESPREYKTRMSEKDKQANK